MNQEEKIKAENNAILSLIKSKKYKEAMSRAKSNLDQAIAIQSDVLEGNCAFTLGRAAHESHLYSEAITAYQKCLEKSMELHNLDVCASVHFTIATALLERPDGDRKQNLEMAIAEEFTALSMLSKTARPLDYAKIKYNMGFAYAELTKKYRLRFGEDAKLCLMEAAHCFIMLNMVSDARVAEALLRTI